MTEGEVSRGGAASAAGEMGLAHPDNQVVRGHPVRKRRPPKGSDGQGPPLQVQVAFPVACGDPGNK